MNVLHIQKFLRSHDPRSAVAKAIAAFGLEVNESGDLVQFNYGQDSPKGLAETDECRGLVLRCPSWEVVAYPFKRFYNWHEVPYAAKVNLNTSRLLEKLDGSMMTLWFDGAAWQVSTRGRALADGTVGSLSKTFADLFWETGLKYPKLVGYNLIRSFSYVFELIGPENRVLTPYSEAELRLLAMRDNTTLYEVGWDELVVNSNRLGIVLPKTFEFKNRDHINSMLSMLPTLDEGFVLVDYAQKIDGSFARIKVKNPAYLAASHLIGNGFTRDKAIKLIQLGEVDEFLSYFPEYHDEVMNAMILLRGLADTITLVYETIAPKAQSSRKEFALEAIKYPFSSILFLMVDKKANTAWDALMQMRVENCVRLFEREIK